MLASVAEAVGGRGGQAVAVTKGVVVVSVEIDACIRIHATDAALGIVDVADGGAIRQINAYQLVMSIVDDADEIASESF